MAVLFSAVAQHLAQVLNEYLSEEHFQQQENGLLNYKGDKCLSLGPGSTKPVLSCKHSSMTVTWKLSLMTTTWGLLVPKRPV